MSLLEREEFNVLPETGSINPCRLRFAQPKISRAFQDASLGIVNDLARALAMGTVDIKKIPAVEIGEFGGRIWSFDTRRLVAFQMARRLLADTKRKEDEEKMVALLIRYKKLDAAGVLTRIVNFEPEARNWGGLQVGIRYGGIGSAVEIFRNPEEAAISGSYMTQVEYDSNIRILRILSDSKKGPRIYSG